MAEYIKRVDVMKICERYSKDCFDASNSRGQDIADSILDDIVEIPSADVVEVIRCKNCKYWYNEIDCRNESGLYRFVPNGDWFCASGKRK